MVTEWSIAGRIRSAMVALAVALMMAPGSVLLAADYHLQTRYTASMAGFKFANFSFDLRMNADHYAVSSQGRARGLAWLFTNAEGQATTKGLVVDGTLRPSAYVMTSRDKGKSSAADVRYLNRRLAEYSALPPFKDNTGRTALSTDSLSGTVDPLTAMLAGFGTTEFNAAACDRSIRVFDGWQQFDLALSFSRVEDIKIAGYSGPAIACGMRYTPIGGHKPALQGVIHLTRGSHKLWLVPTSTDRGLVIAKMYVDTIMGPLKMALTNLTLTRQLAATESASAVQSIN